MQDEEWIDEDEDGMQEYIIAKPKDQMNEEMEEPPLREESKENKLSIDGTGTLQLEEGAISMPIPIIQKGPELDLTEEELGNTDQTRKPQ